MLFRQGIRLADIFIPLEFRASPKALRLQPLDPDERQAVAAALDARDRDYLLVDPKSDWERTLLRRDRIKIADLWNALTRTQPAAVIQASPGMGKSTLLSRIMLSMAWQQLGEGDRKLPLAPHLIPLLIQIREYADYLNSLSRTLSKEERAKQGSLLAFLCWNTEQRLQKKGVRKAKEIAEAIEGWLQQCRCLVMFDGLDEVSDKMMYREIQQRIHDFIQEQCHPDVKEAYNRFLITSRIAEFDAPALAGYRYFLVAELSEEQI